MVHSSNARGAKTRLEKGQCTQFSMVHLHDIGLVLEVGWIEDRHGTCGFVVCPP